MISNNSVKVKILKILKTGSGMKIKLSNIQRTSSDWFDISVLNEKFPLHFNSTSYLWFKSLGKSGRNADQYFSIESI